MCIRKLPFLFVGVLSLLVTACGFYPSTPFEALMAFPGHLEGANDATKNAVQLFLEEEVAGGMILLYSVPDTEAGENELVVTFVTPQALGWRAQSSGWTPYTDADNFVLAYLAGGNVTDLTAVSGISRRGEHVRVVWSDGQSDTQPIVDGAFLLARPQTVTIQRVELLDEAGNVLESEKF